MYEDQDFLTIQERILNRQPSDIGNHEGSFIYEVSGAYSAEFELVYKALDYLITNFYPLTADRDHLISFAEIYNLSPYEPSYAVLQAEFILDEGYEVGIGDTFRLDDIFYTVRERIDSTNYRIECNSSGSIGNHNFGKLLPGVYKPYTPHLRSARIVSLLVPGEDEEDTEEFRARVKRYFNHKAYGGNEADYIEKMLAHSGVGDCKILRCPRGKGTVDVYFITTEWRAPTSEFVEEIQNYLEPKGITGPPEIHRCGLGVAPIGHDVNVYPVKERPVSIGLKLNFQSGYTWDDVKDGVSRQINEYFLSLSKDWGDRNHYTENGRSIDWRTRFITVRLSAIERFLLEVDGVEDYDRYASTIDGDNTIAFLNLNWDEIPVLGELVQETGDGSGKVPDGGCLDCPYGYDCANCPHHG